MAILKKEISAFRYEVFSAGVAGKGLERIKAGDLLQQVARQINGTGGGRPDMAQGGGDDLPLLVELLAGVPEWVRARD